MYYRTISGAKIDIVEYLGCDQLLVEVLSKKSGCFICQVSAQAIENFDINKFKIKHNIVENKAKVIKQTSSVTESAKGKKKRKKRNV